MQKSPSFYPQVGKKPENNILTSKTIVKECNSAQPKFDISGLPRVSLNKILTNVLSNQTLFFDGIFAAEPDKYNLVSSSEKYISKIDQSFKADRNRKTPLIAYFTSQIRKIKFSKFYVFSDAINAAWKSIQSISKFGQPIRLLPGKFWQRK